MLILKLSINTKSIFSKGETAAGIIYNIKLTTIRCNVTSVTQN